MQRLIALVAALMLLTPLVAGTAAAAPAQKADNHPGHQQDVRDDGPADVDAGVDRGNPNGSNGTIKLDGISIVGEFEAHPNNEPHIGCVFEVDAYGFDEGDTIVLEFREWDPTLHQEAIYSLDMSSDGVDDPGEDGAGGGIDIDDEQLVDLAPYLLGDPHPRHGHHVRVDAIVTSGDSEYKKTKVFWTGECATTGSGSTT